MDWLTGIQNAINYIEEHLTEEIDYEEVAKEAACSNFYFQRIFGILCGISIGDYIRNRRLTLAGDELSASDDKVIDIALKYGYESPESFTRAFSRFHGVTPSEAKKDGSKLKSFSRISVKITLSGGSVMNYKIVEKEAFDTYEERLNNAMMVSNANNALLPISVHGFSASVTGPPNIRNNCQTVMRKRIAQAVYCITVKALLTKGKYSSMAVMSVPSACRNIPETASIRSVTTELTHVIIPSNIQSSIGYHLHSCLTRMLKW